MHAYTAGIRWERGDQPFTDGRYARRHEWVFDGGVTVPTSASPQVVPEPLSDAACVDPEEAFVAALSSCHMLWFLHLAADRGLVVDRYDDTPVGAMDPEDEPMWMRRVTLRPHVAFASDSPDAATLRQLHDAAHARCFLAHSVRTTIAVEPRHPAHDAEAH
ncbi:OsmC family protein [Longibacter sp.]|jgi:organic hydroperoxide reductase OsmC/OhrA|uniref:OsmC family protein n=1 Tax=Longibacter sp. TaxID=2045415 RepID=UPI003EBDBC4D